MSDISEPILIDKSEAEDNRGSVEFYNNLDFEMQNTQYNTWLININFQKQEMDHFSERMQVAPVERVPQVFV